MRKTLILTASVFGAMSVLFSCSKSDSSSSVLPSSSYHMSATITKPSLVSAFSATGITYVIAEKKKTICTIFGFDSSGTSVVADLRFTIFDFSGPGKYYFDSSTDSKAVYEVPGSAYAQTVFAKGSITITSISGQNISGSFDGSLTDGSIVTNGRFLARGIGF